VNSFPLSVNTFVVLNGKNSIAFSKNIDAVSALLLLCISRYINLVALSIATNIYHFLPFNLGQYVMSTCKNHGS
jgi:hypothetical protein